MKSSQDSGDKETVKIKFNARLFFFSSFVLNLINAKNVMQQFIECLTANTRHKPLNTLLSSSN